MPKGKVEATFKRVFERVFICMKCNAKMRTDMLTVKKRKVKCRRCGYKGLRPKRKERKV